MYELHTFYFSWTLYLYLFRYSSQGWLLDQIAIFALVDSFVRRCKDLLEVSKHYKMMQTHTHTHKLYIFQMHAEFLHPTFSSTHPEYPLRFLNNSHLCVSLLLSFLVFPRTPVLAESCFLYHLSFLYLFMHIFCCVLLLVPHTLGTFHK